MKPAPQTTLPRSLPWSLAVVALLAIIVALAAPFPGTAADDDAVTEEKGGETATAESDTTASDSTTALRPQGDPKKGKKSYKIKCVACHKANGSGGFKVTKNETPDWRDAKRMADPQYDDDYMRDCIINGKIESGMVGWGKQGMKADEVENLIAYIRTFSAPKDEKGKKK